MVQYSFYRSYKEVRINKETIFYFTDIAKFKQTFGTMKHDNLIQKRK